MRHLLTVAFLVFSSSAVCADDAADAKAIVEKGAKAAGYKTDAKNVNSTFKDEGTINFGGMSVAYTAKWYVRTPDAVRFELAASVMGNKFELVHIVNGDKVWDNAMGMVEEETGDKKEYSIHAVYFMTCYSLTPLLHDKDVKLSTAGQKDIGGKPALGVKIEKKGKPTMTLYFDKGTGLMAKSEVKVKDEFQGWKEVLDENYFEDWKDGDGQKVFTKLRVIRDGKPLIETKLSDQKNPEKLDPKLFEKPLK